MAKKAKMQSHIPVRRANLPLQHVYMDFWGPSRETMGNTRYFLSLIDDHTRFSWLYVKPDRKVENLIQTLDIWLPLVERQSGRMLLVIQTDNAAEFKALVAWGKPKGIEFKFIEPGTPPQNGVAEQFNKVILEIARALLFDARFHKKYWKYAVMVANYLQNQTMLVKDSEDENGRKKTPYELWNQHQPDLSNLRAWGCRVIYHEKNPDSKLDSRVAEGTFMLYGKSNKQYYVLPHGGSELRLVTNPEFQEKEKGYLDPPGQEFSQSPAPEMPKPDSMRGGESSGTLGVPGMSITSESTRGGGPSQETASINAPMINEDKHQPVPMPAPAPSEAPVMPTETERERGNEPSRESRTEPAPSRENEGAVSEKGAEPTPTDDQPANDDSHGDQADAMEVDHDSDQDEAQFEGEKSTLREAMPGHDENSDGEQFYHQEIESPDGDNPNEGRSNKVEECQDKVTPQTVNEDAVERPDVRRSSRIRRPTEGLMESQNQQEYGRKRKTEGEEISDHPAQRLQAQLAKLEVATELLREYREFKVNEEARAAREKAGIWLPKSYSDTVNDPIYGSKWREAIHKELSALISFGTWNVIRRDRAEGTISST